MARNLTSSTTYEQPAVSALSRNNDFVDGGIKRRSLLPQPSLSSVRQSYVAAQTEPSDKDRPAKVKVGWTQPGRELRIGSHREEEPARRVRAPQMPLCTTEPNTDGSTDNKAIASTPTVPVTVVKRSQSLRKPTNIDGVRKPELRGHSRNASAIVKPNEYNARVARGRQSSKLPSSTYSLPQSKSGSAHNSRATSAASTSGSVSNISTRSKTKLTNNRVSDISVTTSKGAPSTAKKGATLTEQTSPDQDQSQSQRSSLERPTSKSISNQPTRPAFNTLQQHYTPKKAAKAPNPSIIAASPTKNANGNVLSSETVRLQTELLELHLLHRTSVEIQRQWEQSAQSTLHRQYEGVVERYRALKFDQNKAQEQTDLKALREWGASHDISSFSRKVELLSQTLQDLGNIDNAGGKFALVTTTFERWIALSESVQELGQSIDAGYAQGTEFLEGLGEDWWAEVLTLEMRLASRALDLKRLGQPLQGSSIAYLVGICTTLVMQMSEEFKTMREIECEVLEKQAAWIRQAIDCIGPDPEEECESGKRKLTMRKGVWQTG